MGSRLDTFACVACALLGIVPPILFAPKDPARVATLTRFSVPSVAVPQAPQPAPPEAPTDPDVSTPDGPLGVYVEPDGTRVTFHGFPALSPDGRMVAVSALCSAPFCGVERVEIRYVAGDAVVEELPLTDGYDHDGQLSPPVAKLRARAERIEQRLAGWTPMGPASWSTNDDRASSVKVGDAEVVVQHEPPVLRLMRDEKRVWSRDVPSWRVPRSSGRDCPGFPDGFTHEISNAVAWVDASHSVVVLEVMYAGNDSCWEPPSQWHVVRIR